MLEVTIPATDGFPLAGTEFNAASRPKHVVLIAPATGVRRRIYDAFAEFLASEGMIALTWDWRGVGESCPDTLRGFRTRMREWGTRDLAGVIDWATERYPNAALSVVGHSFGGQAIGLAGNRDRIRSLVAIAAQSGYWGHWPRPQRYKYALLWYLAMPLATRIAGYFPARRFGLGENLPRGVALEWAEWCRSPEYMGDWGGHRAFRAPIYALSFSDDQFAPKPAVDALLAQYGSTDITHRHLRPKDAGVATVGHFGFFRPRLVLGLWRNVARWIASQ